MSNLLKSIADIWKRTSDTQNLVPVDKVYTGRLPGTKERYDFPYVSVLSTRGTLRYRTDKTRGYHQQVLFSVWVDDSKLASGIAIANAITDTFSELTYEIDDMERVIDVLDEGPYRTIQTTMPAVKAWEVVKLMTFCTERLRTDGDRNDCDDSEIGASSTSTDSESISAIEYSASSEDSSHNN